MDRRRFLKNCSLVPFLALPNSSFGSFTPQATCDDVFVFLHGLMFMEVDSASRTLTVTAPDIHDHKYLFLSLRQNEKVSKELLQPVFRQLDWTTGELGPGVHDSFPKEIPQFSAAATGIGKTRAVGHRFRLILPIPKEVIPVRVAHLPAIKLKGKVGEEIAKNNSFAVVTCLRYGKNTGIHSRHHFYAEPSECGKLLQELEHTNHAFESAKVLFDMPEKFDLLIEKCDSACCVPPEVPRLTCAFEDKDSYHLCEVYKEAITCNGLTFTGGPLCSAMAVTP
jgi:hypothetical protein